MYRCMREWWTERHLLAGLGVKDPDAFDGILADAQDRGEYVLRPKTRTRDRAKRSAEIAAFLAGVGEL